MQHSITLQDDLEQQYLLRIGDTCLILGQRIAQWCGHAPILEEDIALSNMALDLIGQARAVLTLAGKSSGHDEDQLAFLREERHYYNPTLVELPRGDFAFTVVRNTMAATLLALLWEELLQSSNAELAAIAGQALKEARYHQEHAADWLVRLGDGTQESHQRAQAAVNALWLYTPELFSGDAVDLHAEESGLGPSWESLQKQWLVQMEYVLNAATLVAPKASAFISSGKRGVHSEHMGYILAEMQYLQRAYPGGAW
ncbi:phenylacetate-CoA oxygenase subunit PaaI [Comamonas testosteroni]|uniref:Phenylacetate-CoA oxygenase subunit PaaI n=1 Tax=Comamonas testosteroni TaxID=285 RepID=A0A373FIE6_COMTE|nr:1,2-phenylacetyl-CoA epoxidase subunit PaaC [Comamonas testosteroni]RGE43272.1 phenylacetate-CoA oxygenase subunit PaaI [Comamonas testosteroni]